jgi:acyl transferase domain-containing protein/acyl carrier protein
MSEFLERISQMSPKRLTLLTLELKAKLDEALSARQEPIAIVGMACRFPGDADSPAAFWELLRGGVDAIREVPPDRWDIDAFYDPDPEAPGHMATRFGGFLANVDRFDAALFGISPREAVSMDPQQRLLLEVGWEALEDAGEAPDALGGSSTGVFVGVCNADYYQVLGRQGLGSIDLYGASGNAGSVISGRLSYVLGFHGPAISVDTACSSSLVAVHLACQSLWSGECSRALAGGVNVICAPDTTVALSQSRMMAPDGRCKAFDSRADGFVRGEGCGVVVLKRLADARAAGDRVLALIRGTACNQDGRSSGLTAPNGPSQEAVIRAALARAGVEPAEVDYVESHGTGTSLGDPIEARALGAVLRPGRDPGRPALLGSVKTNLGHLESAAGIAGLVKVVLSLQHEAIPPHLHLRELNPHVDWSSLPLRIPTELTPWPRGERRRVAGASSFGFSGTNAHIVLEEAPLPEKAAPAAVERPIHALALSGKTEAALRAGAVRLASHLDAHPDEPLADLAYSANVGRAHLPHRALVLAGSREEARERLLTLAEGNEAPGVIEGRAPAEAPRLAFLFTGQGAQAVGMGRGLYDTEPVFRDALDRCAEILKGQLDRPLLDLMFGARGAEGLIDRTGYTQPCLFSLEWALFELFRSWGVLPSAVLGHSLGELTAACVAGVFSLEDALSLVVERARLMESLPSFGSMASVFADEARVSAAISKSGGRLWIAALNAPDNVVVSGEEQALTALLAAFEAEGVNSKRLVISNAFHSPLVEPMLEPLVRKASAIPHHPPQMDLVSNLSGGVVRPGEIDPAYWGRHVRDAVRFAPSLRTLAGQGYRIFVELGPHPTLLNLAQGSLGADTVYLPSLRRGADDWQTILESLGALYVRGTRIDWAGFDRGYGRRKRPLPTYPFQRERFWVDAPQGGQGPAVAALAAAAHPLLGHRLQAALPTFEVRLGPQGLPLLGEHRVYDVPLAAAPVIVEMLRAAAAEAGTPEAGVEDLVLREALIFPEGADRVVQVALTPAEEGAFSARVFSRAPDDHDPAAWSWHASARIVRAPTGDEASFALEAARARLSEQTPAAFYEALGRRGVELGPAFQRLERLWRGSGEALGLVGAPDHGGPPAGWDVDPGLLDSCLQVLGAAAPGDWADGDAAETFLLTGFDHARILAPLPRHLWSHARLGPAGSDGSQRGDIVLCDDAGRGLGELRGVRMQRARKEALWAAVRGGEDGFYELGWPAKPLAGQRIAGPTAEALPSAEALAERVRPRLVAHGREHGIVFYDEVLPGLDALAGAYVDRALAALGWKPRAGETVEPGELARRLRIQDSQARLFRRLLETLAERGLLAPSGQGYAVSAPLPAADPEEIGDELVRRQPDCAAEAALVRRCGEGLADVLRGARDPLSLLFPDGSFTAVERLYQDSRAARAYNRALADAVAAAAEALPPGRTLRVLEIGAGTGGSSSFILPLVPRERTKYVFTDLSRLFMTRAAEKFRDYPFVEYRLLDAERPFAPQGVPARSFDLVVASNVLHATRDLSETLRHAREALSPGGLLILLEGTRAHLWVDVTFGLTEGWWRFEDAALRPSYPLLDAPRWRALLTQVGFEGAASVYGESEGEGLGEQSILIAREPLKARAAAAEAVGTRAAGSFWLVLGEGAGLSRAFADAVTAEGGRAEVAVAVPSTPEGVKKLVEDVRVRAGDVELLALYARALDRPFDEGRDGAGVLDAEVASAAEFAAVLAALAAGGGRARLSVVTRGAQAILPGEACLPSQATLWGLGRVAALEHPGLFGALVDLDPAGASDEAVTLLDELLGGDGEDQSAFRGGARHVARLVRGAAPKSAPARVSAEGRHLVTGGLGGLGLSLARWLVDKGARHLVLTSRRGLPPRESWPTLPPESDAARQAAVVRELEARGARVDVVSVDVADEAAMSRVLAGGPAEGPVRSVFHLAADMSGAPLAQADAAAFAGMFRAKVGGAWTLHRLCEGRALDAFVLFSSTTALLGVAGLGHYAAANQFLDALATWRRARGRPALSVNWGTWETMRRATEEEQRQFLEGGLLPMETGWALDAMARLVGAGAARAVVARVDWQALKAVYETRRRRPLLETLGAAPAAAKATKASRKGPASDLLRRVQEAPQSKRRDLVLAHVRGEAARILGLDPSQPMAADQGLFEMGMDSLMSVELKSRLEGAVGRALPSTLTFNYPNVGALTDYLLREVLVEAAPVPAVPTPRPDAAPAAGHEAPAAALDELSEDQLAAMLAAKLGAKP